MNGQEKLLLILDYQNAVRRLKEMTLSASGEELDFRPQADFWTIREHLAHVMDCEAFGFTRYRKAVAEPGTAVESFDQDPWQANLDYAGSDTAKTIQIIEFLVERTVLHLLAIVDQDWSGFFIRHPERGNDNLESLIGRRVFHLNTHMDFIRRNKNLFTEDRYAGDQID